MCQCFQVFNPEADSQKIKCFSNCGFQSIAKIKKEEIARIIKYNGKTNLTSVELERENPKVIGLKRVENLKMIYESGMVEFLEEKFPGTVIILFGSYSYGEDTINSDIDIAVIGTKSKETDMVKFEKFLEREININTYQNIKGIHKNLKSNILNGIILVGRINL